MPFREEIIQQFPPLSVATVELLRSLSHDPSLREIADIVVRDAILSARILQLANSPRYATTREITDVAQAAVALGRDTIRRIAISAGLRRGVRGATANPLMTPLWEHSLATAILAQSIAAELAPDSAGALYTAGLLHDIGAMALASWKPGPYATIVEAAATPGFDPIAWEQSVLAVDRHEAGGWLAEEWELPANLRVALGPPQPATDGGPLGCVIAAASDLAEAYGYGLVPADDSKSNEQILAQYHLERYGAQIPPKGELDLGADVF